MITDPLECFRSQGVLTPDRHHAIEESTRIDDLVRIPLVIFRREGAVLHRVLPIGCGAFDMRASLMERPSPLNRVFRLLLENLIILGRYIPRDEGFQMIIPTRPRNISMDKNSNSST